MGIPKYLSFASEFQKFKPRDAADAASLKKVFKRVASRPGVVSKLNKNDEQFLSRQRGLERAMMLLYSYLRRAGTEEMWEKPEIEACHAMGEQAANLELKRLLGEGAETNSFAPPSSPTRANASLFKDGLSMGQGTTNDLQQ